MMVARPLKTEESLSVFLGIFGCVFAFFFLGFLLQTLIGKENFQEGTLLYLVFGSLSLHGSILLGTGVCFHVYGASWTETFGFRKGGLIKVVCSGLLAALLFLPVGMILQGLCTGLLEMIHYRVSPQLAIDEFLKAKGLASRIYMTFAAVIMAPIAEEVLFRGLLFNMLRQALNRRWAYLIMATLFAAIHASLPIFIPLAVLGALLAWIYEKTGNLLTSILAHAFFNSMNLVIIFYGDDMMDRLKQFYHSL